MLDMAFIQTHLSLFPVLKEDGSEEIKKHMSFTTATLASALPHQGTALQENEATLGFSVTHSHGHFMVRMCWWPFSPACLRLLRCFHTFVNPSVCHPNRTLSSKHSLIGQNCLFGSCGPGLPTECSTAAVPQQRLGGCSGLRAQGGGVWLASPSASETRGSYMEHSQMS